MNKIEQLLNSALYQDTWIISKPENGMSKESYIAESSKQRVFVKFDVSSRSMSALEFLSKLDIVPKLIAKGEDDGRTYIVQEFIEGIHPSREWFSENIKSVAELIKKYHDNEELRKSLAGTQTTDYKIYLDEQINFLEKYLRTVDSPVIDKELILDQINSLREYSGKFIKGELVVTHADPNPSNFIVSGNIVYLIDWDDLTLSDEMRDISLLLGRYVSSEARTSFFEEYGANFEQVSDRFYWWMAHGSLVIALWFSERNDEFSVKEYLRDFKFALNELK